MKDFIAGRLSIAAGEKGRWNVYRDIDRRYCDQVCAEQKIEHKDKKGRITLEWEKISSHAQNHMLDVETNNALAAEILGVRYLQEDDGEGAVAEATQKNVRPEDDWLGSAYDNWF